MIWTYNNIIMNHHTVCLMHQYESGNFTQQVRILKHERQLHMFLKIQI